MIYFNSKYLSEKLGINAARWKRWSREFLKPDPLGGYQSGYARQFSFKDAFRVFLGGHLVGEHRFSITDTRKILSDLEPWLKKQGFYNLPSQSKIKPENRRWLYISRMKSGKFTYVVRTLVRRQYDPSRKKYEDYTRLEVINDSSDDLEKKDTFFSNVILINGLHFQFVQKIEVTCNIPTVDP